MNFFELLNECLRAIQGLTPEQIEQLDMLAWIEDNLIDKGGEVSK